MCMNHQYRPQVLDKIRGVILMGYRLYCEDPCIVDVEKNRRTKKLFN